MYYDASASLLYLSDGHLIRKITPSGIVATMVGSATSGTVDGIGTNAQFNSIRSLAIASNGTLLTTDSANNQIRSVALFGKIICNCIVGYSHLLCVCLLACLLCYMLLLWFLLLLLYACIC